MRSAKSMSLRWWALVAVMCTAAFVTGPGSALASAGGWSIGNDGTTSPGGEALWRPVITCVEGPCAYNRGLTARYEAINDAFFYTEDTEFSLIKRSTGAVAGSCTLTSVLDCTLSASGSISGGGALTIGPALDLLMSHYTCTVSLVGHLRATDDIPIYDDTMTITTSGRCTNR